MFSIRSDLFLLLSPITAPHLNVSFPWLISKKTKHSQEPNPQPQADKIVNPDETRKVETCLL